MQRDYLADLELDLDATPDDVKRSYRRLARKFHPDVNPGDFHAAESFRRIQEAFDFLEEASRMMSLKDALSRLKKRRRTKQKWSHLPICLKHRRHEWFEEPTHPGRTNVHVREDLLDLHLEVESKEALNSLVIRALAPCENCRGKGGTAQAAVATCKTCAGLGYQAIERGAFRWKKSCDLCLGKGYVVEDGCSQCAGQGKIYHEKIMKIKTPKEWTGSEALRVSGAGHVSYDGKTKGDLWIHQAKKK